MEFDISSISAIVAAFGVLIGIVFALLELRHLHRERETDLLVKMAPWLNMDSDKLLEAYVRVLNLEFKNYDEFVKKYGSPFAEKPEQMAIMTIGNYFEAIGALIKRKLLDIDLMWDYWGETFIVVYQKLKPYVEGVKREFNQPEFADSTEFLYNEMKKRGQQLAKTQ